MKVIIDTNVLFSGLFWRDSNEGRLLNLILENKIQPVCCNLLLNEYFWAFKKFLNKISKKYIFDKNILEKTLNGFLNYFEFYEVNPMSFKIVKADPKDDMLFHCAIQLNVKYIITGDKEVLNVKEFKGVEPITAKDFLIKFFNNF